MSNEEFKNTENVKDLLILPCDENRPYVFVSYSSVDKDIVWEDVVYLQQLGYNIWIDIENLQVGKTWDGEALKAISRTYCKKLIYYVSKNSLTSEPCLKELMRTREEDTLSTHRAQPLDFIPIDVEPISDLVQYSNEIYDLIENSGKPADDVDREGHTLTTIRKEFFNNNNGIDRIMSKDNPKRKKEYYEEIIQALPDETKCFNIDQIKQRYEEAVEAKKNSVCSAQMEELHRKSAEQARRAEAEAMRQAGIFPGQNSMTGASGTGYSFPNNSQPVYSQPLQNNTIQPVYGQPLQNMQVQPAPKKKHTILKLAIAAFILFAIITFASQLKKYNEASEQREAESAADTQVSDAQEPVEEVEEANPVEEDVLNLKDMTPYEDKLITYEVPIEFTYDNRVWKNAMIFRAGNGEDTAYAAWDIGGNYNTLTFEVLPYTYDGHFFESSLAEIVIIDDVSGTVLHTDTIKYDSGIVKVTVDVTDVKQIRIMATKRQGMLAYVIVSDVEVVKEGI